ncbi:MAG: hypothetical protein QXP77_03490 [Candidatus Aenigmatarchaeota archaeon]
MEEIYVTTIRKILGDTPKRKCEKHNPPKEVEFYECSGCEYDVGDAGCIYPRRKEYEKWRKNSIVKV